MKPEDLPADDWAALEEAFAWAGTSDLASLQAFLVALQAQRPALASELESMLGQAETHGTTRLERPQFAEELVGTNPLQERINSRIGAYRITGVIASGGMGDVLIGERADGAFEQTVAIKLLREGLQFGSFAERFVQERQTLAQLKHPHIASLLDGGTTEDGMPYLVMEHVDGVDLLHHAERHGATTTARIDLALAICSAVQHAHTQLVIHRDLKPGNILVDDAGQVKLLDFGIAKLLDPEVADADLTVEQFSLLTPEYASPEQLRGEAVGTASDLYSLCLVLYRLFGGEAPYALEGLSRFDMARTVGEQAVPPLRRRIPGFPKDLDAILQVGLRKEPERRYASAHALAEDLRRFRRGLPVTARPDTFRYRTQRFLQRNRLPVSLAAVAVLAGVVGLTAFVQSSKDAMRKALTTSRVSQFLIDFFTSPDPWAEGASDMALQEFFDVGIERMFVDLEEEEEVRAELAVVLGEVLVNLGEEEQAIALLERALAEEPDMAKRDAAMAADLAFHRGIAQRRSGALEEAERSLQECLRLRLQEFGPESEEAASAWNTLGLVHHTMGALEEAEEEYRKALVIREALEGADAFDTAATRNNLGGLALSQGQLEDAVGHFEHALRIHRLQYAETEHPDLATTLNNLGMGLEAVGRLEESEQAFHESLAIRRRLLASDHPHLAGSLNNLGLLEETRGRYAEAAARFQEALDVIADRAPEGHPLRLRIEDNLAAMQEMLLEG